MRRGNSGDKSARLLSGKSPVRTGELRAFVGKKQERLTPEESANTEAISSYCQHALLPGDALLCDVQMQFVDDSLHAVRIALREKPLEIS
jgi:hypothetical protein